MLRVHQRPAEWGEPTEFVDLLEYLIGHRPSWMSQGACRGKDLNLFFGETEPDRSGTAISCDWCHRPIPLHLVGSKRRRFCSHDCNRKFQNEVARERRVTRTPTQLGSAARSLCKSCPVKAECLAEALKNPDTQGIWGGTSKKQRDKIRLGKT